jgi:hypothetical protein
MKRIIILMLFCQFPFYGCKNREIFEINKSSSCNTGVDKCSIAQKNGSCLALYLIEKKECFTEYESEKIVPYAKQLDVDEKINFSVKNIKLSKIAFLFDSIKGNKISVPPEKQETDVSISVKDTSIKKLLESLGLTVIKEGMQKEIKK